MGARDRSGNAGAATSSRAPRVTVLMPTYNAERYLRDAIDSILSQTWTDFELLVIDDGSTDQSPKLVRSYGDPRVRLTRNERNLGIIKSLNRGISLARGEFVARMDGDDVSLPERLERQVRYLEANPQIDILGTELEMMDEEGRTWDPPQFFRVPSNPVAVTWSLFFSCRMHHPTIMARRAVLEALNGYDDAYPHAEDYALYLKALGRFQLSNLSEVFLRLRRHPNSVTRRHQKVQFESGSRAVQWAYGGYVGRDVLLDTVGAARRWNTVADAATAVEVAEFVRNVFWYCETRFASPYPEAVREVRDEAIALLSNMAGAAASDPAAWDAVERLRFQVDPDRVVRRGLTVTRGGLVRRAKRLAARLGMTGQ